MHACILANGIARRHALSFADEAGCRPPGSRRRRVCAGPANGFPLTGTVRYPPRVSLISVISDGTPKRFGGPQYPVPRLV